MANKTNSTINGVNYYRIRADIGKNADGSRIRKSFYGKNKKEAEQKRDEYLNQLKLGLNIDFDKATLGYLMHSWLYDFKRVEVIAELLGHSFTEITKIYAHILDDDKQKAVAKLNEMFSPI